MLPTKALVKEWLLEIAAHTAGFHVIEQATPTPTSTPNPYPNPYPYPYS